MSMSRSSPRTSGLAFGLALAVKARRVGGGSRGQRRARPGGAVAVCGPGAATTTPARPQRHSQFAHNLDCILARVLKYPVRMAQEYQLQWRNNGALIHVIQCSK